MTTAPFDTRIGIRASILPGYLDCQLRAAVTVLGSDFREHGYEIARPRSNIGALFGSGMHGGGEAALKELMLAGSMMPLSAIEDASITAFRARHAEEVEYESDLVMDEDSPTIDAAEAQLRRAARQWRADVLESANPIAVESYVEADLLPGVKLTGHADLLHLDGQGTRRRLRDLKTSRRKQTGAKFQSQIGAYSLLFRSEGYETTDAQIDHLRRVPISKPQPPMEMEPLEVEACEQIAHSTLTDFATKALAFRDDGDPSRFLVNPASMLCSPRFCRAFGSAVCPATRRT